MVWRSASVSSARSKAKNTRYRPGPSVSGGGTSCGPDCAWAAGPARASSETPTRSSAFIPYLAARGCAALRIAALAATVRAGSVVPAWLRRHNPWPPRQRQRRFPATIPGRKPRLGRGRPARARARRLPRLLGRVLDLLARLPAGTVGHVNPSGLVTSLPVGPRGSGGARDAAARRPGRGQVGRERRQRCGTAHGDRILVGFQHAVVRADGLPERGVAVVGHAVPRGRRLDDRAQRPVVRGRPAGTGGARSGGSGRRRTRTAAGCRGRSCWWSASGAPSRRRA